MNNARRRLAELVVRFFLWLEVARRVARMGFWLLIALVLACIGHWVVDILALVTALCALRYALELAEAYLTATPEQHPNEVEHYFESNLLHHPRRPVEPRQRRRQHDND